MMNGYELSRQWFDFAFENPDKVSVTQTALYMWLIEANNRKGWAEKFPFNTADACSYIGVSNRKTVWKALNELVELGFVCLIFKSSNQQKPSVISLKVPKVITEGALDRALSLSEKRTASETAHGQAREQLTDSLGNSSETASGHSYKPKTSNLKPEREQQSSALPDAKIPFNTFWDLYDKKRGRKKAEPAWNRLTKAKQEAALAHIPKYVASTPDKQIRKDPITYLNGECWEDEIIPMSSLITKPPIMTATPGFNLNKALEEQSKKAYQ